MVGADTHEIFIARCTYLSHTKFDVFLDICGIHHLREEIRPEGGVYPLAVVTL